MKNNFGERLKRLSEEQRTAVVSAFKGNQTPEPRNGDAAAASEDIAPVEEADHDDGSGSEEGNTQITTRQRGVRAKASAQLPPLARGARAGREVRQ